MKPEPETIAFFVVLILFVALLFAGFSTPQTLAEKVWERAEFINK